MIFASQPFAFSGDSCLAKAGLATTGSCALVETVNLTITAGNLKQSKSRAPSRWPGSPWTARRRPRPAALQDVTVKDYRGGPLGWSLVGRFNGLTGPASPRAATSPSRPAAMTWTPSCAAAANNDDTVVTGGCGRVPDAGDRPAAVLGEHRGLGADGTSGGDTAADAGLSLAVGANQAAGSYTGTITLTLS